MSSKNSDTSTLEDVRRIMLDKRVHLVKYAKWKAINRIRRVLAENRPLRPEEFSEGLEEGVLDWKEMREDFLRQLQLQ